MELTGFLPGCRSLSYNRCYVNFGTAFDQWPSGKDTLPDPRVQDMLGDAASDGRRLLQAVAGKAVA
jgi:hypothetical protein